MSNDEKTRWNGARLDDVVSEWTTGQTPSRARGENFCLSGGYPWVRTVDVRGGVLTETSEQLTELGVKGLRPIREDSVLFTVSGAVGRAALAGRDVYCSRAVLGLRFREELMLPEFGYYHLRYCGARLAERAAASTHPYITRRELRELRVFCPSLAEQRRVVARLRPAEELCELGEALCAALERLLRGSVAAAAKRAEKTVRLHELLLEPIRAGRRRKDEQSGTPREMVADLLPRAGRSALPESVTCHVSSREDIREDTLRERDILLRRTSREHTLIAGMAGENERDALFGAEVLRVRLAPEVSSAFVCVWLNGRTADDAFDGSRLQAERLKDLFIPAPREAESLEWRLTCMERLAEKAEELSETARRFLSAELRAIFGGLPDAPRGETREEHGADRSRLTAEMTAFLGQLSAFQKELYEALLRTGSTPAHTLLKSLRGAGANRTKTIQDALASLSLLEQFGLAEREGTTAIGRAGQDAEESAQLLDHNGRPIRIETYKPTADIFEESEYAPEKGNDPEL